MISLTLLEETYDKKFALAASKPGNPELSPKQLALLAVYDLGWSRGKNYPKTIEESGE